MNTTLTIPILLKMISEEGYVPYQRAPRDFKKVRKEPNVSKEIRASKVNMRMRKQHNIKQPGFDVQRRNNQ